MKKKITIYEDHLYRADYPSNLSKMIVWLQAILDKVPQEYQDSVTIDTATGEYNVYVSVSYEREETEEEKEARMSCEKVLATKRENLEWKQYNLLKKKFDSTP